MPRQRILRDEALYDIANQMPSTPEQLSELRTLSEGFARSARAKDIIEAVKRGVARDMKTVPQLNHCAPLSAEATATTELLKVLLKSAAARHRVAPRMIADTEDLERIASEAEPDVAALKGWRRQLVRRGCAAPEARRAGADAVGRRSDGRARKTLVFLGLNAEGACHLASLSGIGARCLSTVPPQWITYALRTSFWRYNRCTNRHGAGPPAPRGGMT